MKLSAFLCSYGYLYEQGASTEQVVDLAVQQGFGGIEPFPTDDLATVDDARRVGRYVRDQGLEITCFSTCCELLDDRQAQSMQDMRRLIDMAAAMGSPYFHHTIHPPLGTPRPGDLHFAQALDQAAPLVRALCAYAADRGVLCVYEDQGMYFNGCDQFGRLVEALGDAPFGVVADLGNIFFVDEQPEQFVGRFSDKIVHVHLKDYLRKSGAGPCPGKGWYVTRGGDFLRDTIAGHGVANFGACFRLLEQAGYDGWYSLEYAAMEPASFGIPMSLDNVRRFRDDVLRNPAQLPLLDSISPRFE